MDRVVVTGLGAITPLGIGALPLFEACLGGQNGIGPLDGADASGLPIPFGAPVRGFEPHEFIPAGDCRHLDRFAQLGAAAAAQALADAGIDLDRVDRDRAGVVIGTAHGGLEEILEQTRRLHEHGPSRIMPYFIPRMMPNAASGYVALRHGLKGPNCATVAACAAGAHAFAYGLDLIRAGRCDVVLAGGADAALNRLGMGGYASARALSRRADDPAHASRPFDRDRDGFVMGEGAGIALLERESHARSRGARFYCELAGAGMTDDAHHLTHPEPEGRGAAKAMRLALADARLSPEGVQYLNAHGTSTPLNDVTETLAIKAAFGPSARALAISSTKSMMGHLLGAAGAVEAIVAALSCAQDKVPPTINLEHPDPQCDLDYVPRVARDLPVHAALSNSFGFGGHNITLAFRKYSG